MMITAMTIVPIILLGYVFDINKPHSFVGSLFMVFIFPIAITGIASLIMRRFSTWNTKMINRIRRVHKYMAGFFVLASIFEIYSGIYVYYQKKQVDLNDQDDWAEIYLYFTLVLFSVCELYYRSRKDISIVELKLPSKYEGCVMNEEEFNHRILKGD